MFSEDKLLGKRILLLTAHPDDESFCAAGTLHKNFKAGGENILVCATLGEKGKSHLKKPATAAEIKSVRQQELMEAAKCVGVSQVHFLGLPDTKVKEYKKAIGEKTEKFVSKYKPDILMTFGPEGISGHRDHVSLYEVGRRVSRKTGVSLCVFALPNSLSKHADTASANRRRFGVYKNEQSGERPNVKIKIDSALKLKTVRKHRSQYSGKDPFVGFPAAFRQAWLKHEYFRLFR